MVAAATRAAVVTKIAIWCAGVLAVVSTAAGVVQLTRPANGVQEPIALRQPLPPVNQNAEAEEMKLAAEPGLDQFHDRLPDKAIARLGTVAFRHGAALNPLDYSLTFTADGKHLVSMGGGWIRRWNLTTGNATVNLGEPSPQGWVDSSTQVTADGKTACICREPFWNQKKGFTRDFIQYDLASGAQKQSYPLKFHPSISLHPIFSPDGKVCGIRLRGE